MNSKKIISSLIHKDIKKGILTFFFLFTGQFIYSQEKSLESIDIFSDESFDTLSNTLEQSESDEKALSLAKAYLLKARRENKLEKNIQVYELIAKRFSQTPNYDVAFQYLDSIISLTINNPGFTQPAQAYILKAQIYGSQTDYTEAMDNLAEANTYANKSNNNDQQSEIRYFIALLKNEIGEYEESLDLFKANLAYYKSRASSGDDYEKEYLQTLYAIGYQYNILEKPDSALIYTNQAITLSLKTEDSLFYDRLIISAAGSFYQKKEYQSALDNVETYRTLREKKDLSFADILRIENFYGLIYYKQGKKDLAIKYLSKVDSIAHANNFFPSTLKENYEILIEYYQSKNEIKKQLEYIDKLLAFDKVLDQDASYLSKQLNDAYNRPNLILAKQKIIDLLEKKNRDKKIVLSALSILLSSLIVVLLWNYNRQKQYKKRFQELLQNSELKKVKDSHTYSIEAKSDLGISEDIINDVLHKLEDFEKNLDFLQKDISVNNLSVQFGTNSKYFSRIINTHKSKNFTNYINELRIQYVIEELKVNSKLRNYTIKAIGNEIGFNTAEAFSKSFFKVTQLYPSYFIKKLEKQNLVK
ncbi:Two-component response regulator, YesN/AraC family, consists of REC and AraC-type DNA-binding domains [Marivirga sericea]|uniref:Two-component response regulator, YesN/AraC family, consists of REC and AraC-type DNA-binding domains n=1 Tax=Marivirga sericea TaxID=1028 RepID=A0A1X7JMH1_9BACT|nr:helix-turn-helix domain-containing protein [Marivirga sericea]SMG28840.1 Two-component response regulator, YesN/AraC family, consists of REC and AraC-type DNA-binding domains [Marivirga sericea]